MGHHDGISGERTWTVQDARAHFGDVIDGALKGKPQRISRRGKDAVVVISEDEWRRLAGPRPNLGEFLTTYPGLPDEVDLLAARKRPSRRPVPFSGED